MHYSPRSDHDATQWGFAPTAPWTPTASEVPSNEAENMDVVLQQAFLYNDLRQLKRATLELLMAGGEWRMHLNYTPTCQALYRPI